MHTERTDHGGITLARILLVPGTVLGYSSATQSCQVSGSWRGNRQGIPRSRWGVWDGEPQLDLDAWRQALRELESIEADRVHGGRGESATLDEALDDRNRARDHDQAIQERVAARFPDYELP